MTKSIDQLLEELDVSAYTREQFEADHTRLLALLCAKHNCSEVEIAVLLAEHRYVHSAEDLEVQYMGVLALGREAGWIAGEPAG